MSVLLVGLGSALGGMSRYLVADVLFATWQQNFPFGTLLVNVGGCFLVGLLSGAQANMEWKRFLGTGFAGGFTTYSTFNAQLYTLNPLFGSLYLGASLVLGMGAHILGRSMGSRIG